MTFLKSKLECMLKSSLEYIILNHKSAFYELKTGCPVLNLDVSGSILKQNLPLFWKFSDDLERLVVLDTDRVLWVLNICDYTAVKGDAVQIEHERHEKLQGDGEFVNYSASRMGDELWRKKLSFLFKKYHQGKDSNQWYLQDKKGPKKSIRTASKHKTKKYRVSGFHKEREEKEPEDSYVESKMVLSALDATECCVTDLMFYHSVVSIKWKMNNQVLLVICNYRSGAIMQER